jgi:glycosyltransferase involved in cell wall biosynthesis
MDSRIRILEVTATLKPAGAEHMLVSLASALNSDRFDVSVVSLFNAFPGGLEPALDQRRIPVWHLGKVAGPDVRMYARLKQVVDTFRPDIIHTHCYVTRYTFPLRAKAMVHTVHNIASLEADRVGRAINRYAFRKGVVPIAVGAAVADSVRELYRLERPISIPNGIDTLRFRYPANRSLWRRLNGFCEEDLLVVSVGRLTRQKNPMALVDAITQVPGAQLLLAGEGELQNELVGHPRVHLLGVRQDIPELLSCCDIFALASRWEGLPLAVLEAMAAGMPIVATSVGCVPEIVQHEKSGFLVHPGNQEELVTALRLLGQSATLRRKMGEEARIRAESFSLQAMVSAYEHLFLRLFSSPVPA